MAIFHAFFDESGKKTDHPVVTFCGVCVSQSKLEQFDKAWIGLLQYYDLSYLHLAEALRPFVKLSDKVPKQSVSERIETLKPFADCINNHLELGLLQAWDVKGFNSLSKNARAKLGSPTDPYYVAFARGIVELMDYVHGDDRISLTCDHDEETAWDCYRHYRGIRNARGEIREKTIALRFADDKHFPALQAADMVAVLTRFEARHQFYKKEYKFTELFDYLVRERGPNLMQWRKMFADEATVTSLSKSLENPKRPRS
jgi:hypothetical protein